MPEILHTIKGRDPWEKEFHQAVREVAESVQPVLKRNPHYERSAALERLTEPSGWSPSACPGWTTSARPASTAATWSR